MIVLQVESLKKYFGDVKAVDDVSFNVKEGEIFGLLGPNGAGKTTTISVITTILKPTGGNVKLLGFDVVKDQDAVRKVIGIVFQDPSIDTELTGRENLDLHGRLYGMPSELRKKRIAEVLKLVELEDAADRQVKEYSGGMRRRLEIARGLMHRPKVLFLDEPTLGLDPQTRRKVWDYINNIRKSDRMTIILTTHYMEEADALCDRIAIIDYGKIIALDTPKNLKRLLGRDVITLTFSENCPMEKVMKVLQPLKFIKKMKCVNSKLNVAVTNATKTLPEVIRKLERNGLNVLSIEIHQPTLEDVFIQYTGRSIRDEKASIVDRMRFRRMTRFHA
jgi:ABC-2 type transport system ATP-binding protein